MLKSFAVAHWDAPDVAPLSKTLGMKMKRKLASLILVFIAWPIIAFAGWPDVDIELSTCQPDGSIAKISQLWDPLKFWVKQNVALEMALEEEDLKGLLDNCRIEHREDRTALLECYQFYKTDTIR